VFLSLNPPFKCDASTYIQVSLIHGPLRYFDSTQSIRPLLRFRRSRALQVVDADIRNDSDISILPHSADLLRESRCSRLDHRCSVCFFVFVYLIPFWSSGLLAMSTVLPLPDTVF
jgi:hypothetical protein